MESWRKVERFFKPLLPYLLSALVGAGISFAGPIKNWTTGEYVTYTDLNATLNHLHSNLGHGHGPIITSADISPSANIRPEQTTFGASINKSLVFVGTFRRNPDGGTAYVPTNTSGTLAVSVNGNVNGFVISGAASSGFLSDGGTDKYTVFYTTVGGDAGTILCVPISDPTLSSPLSLATYCDGVFGTTPVGGLVPPGVSVQVFDNKAQ